MVLVLRTQLHARECVVEDGVLEFEQVAEVGVLQGVLRGDALFRVVGEQLVDQVHGVPGHVRYELLYARALLLREIELHVRGQFLEAFQDLRVGCAEYVVDFVNLVELGWGVVC